MLDPDAKGTTVSATPINEVGADVGIPSHIEMLPTQSHAVEITLFQGQAIRILLADSDGEFEVHYGTTQHPEALVIKETAGLPGSHIGEAFGILYREEFGTAPYDDLDGRHSGHLKAVPVGSPIYRPQVTNWECFLQAQLLPDLYYDATTQLPRLFLVSYSKDEVALISALTTDDIVRELGDTVDYAIIPLSTTRDPFEALPNRHYTNDEPLAHFFKAKTLSEANVALRVREVPSGVYELLKQYTIHLLWPLNKYYYIVKQGQATLIGG